jgi:hypothetical protein
MAQEKQHITSRQASIIGFFVFVVGLFALGIFQSWGKVYENVPKPVELTVPAGQPTIVVQTPGVTVTIPTPVKK